MPGLQPVEQPGAPSGLSPCVQGVGEELGINSGKSHRRYLCSWSPACPPVLSLKQPPLFPPQAWETEQGKWVLIIAHLGSMEPGALEGKVGAGGHCQAAWKGCVGQPGGAGSPAELGASRMRSPEAASPRCPHPRACVLPRYTGWMPWRGDAGLGSGRGTRKGCSDMSP